MHTLERQSGWSLRVGGILAVLAVGGCAGAEDERTFGSPGVNPAPGPAADAGAASDDDTGLDAAESDDDDEDDGVGDDDRGTDDGENPAGTTGSDQGAEETAGPGEGGDDGTVLIHFNATGAALTPGTDNAPAWQSETIAANLDLAAHADPQRAAQVMTALQGIVADYPFEIVSEDPGKGASYTMVVVTAAGSQSAGMESGLLSVGLADCGNANPNNVLLVFDDPALDLSVEAIANSIAFAVGGAMGLNANETAGDAMALVVSKSAASFTDACVTIPGQLCPPMPAGTCGPGEQNSHAAMHAAFD